MLKVSNNTVQVKFQYLGVIFMTEVGTRILMHGLLKQAQYSGVQSGEGRTGRRPRASKAGGIQKVKL